MQSTYKGKYQRLQRIGNGAYGVIYKVKSIPKGQIFIAKHIALGKVERQSALKEFEILQKIKHLYIVKYQQEFEQEDQLILIMQYCGRIEEQIQKKTLHGIQNKEKKQHLITGWILQMLLAIGFLHSNKIVHRDIKPQNIFIDEDMNLKIGDFGIAKILESTLHNCKTTAGTPNYMPPEMLQQQKYSTKADIWSLGCVIYQICALQKAIPMRDANDKALGLFKIMDLVRKADIKNIPSIYSQDLQRIVKKMLTKVPQKRPRAEDILKDKYLVQMMVNRINQKDGLKKQYSKGLEMPVLTDSFLDKQSQLVRQQLKKLQTEVMSKMLGLKKQKCKKQSIQKYQLQIKQKMKQVQLAVQKAFRQLNSRAKTQKNKSQISNKSSLSSSNNSDVTIQSIQMASKKQINKNQSQIQLVQSQMIESKFQKKKPMKNNSNMSETIQSCFSQSIKRPQKRLNQQFQTTVQTQFASTNSPKQQILQNTINKLQLLTQTLKKNPKAILSDSFLNCSLQISEDLRYKKEDISATISLQLTAKSPPLITLDKKQKKIQQQDEYEKYYSQQFQQFEPQQQNQYLNDRRNSQLKTMLSLYQQTLNDLHRQQNLSEASKIKNKYLVMSQIKQQSNEGGSMISRQQSL